MRFFVDGSIKTPVTEYLTNPKYQQVEYLESTGTQYIDTGYTQTSMNIKFETHVYTPDIPDIEQGIFGYAAPSNFGLVIGLYQNKVFLYTHQSASSGADANVYSSVFSGENDFIISGETNESLVKTLTVNGIVYTKRMKAQLTDFKSMLLFMANPSEGMFLGRIYYCKIYDSGTLVRHFIPAVRKEDGKPGMYDKVSGQFFTNAGTGEFLYGNPVYNGVPKGYKECEYLESTGTQWIDTGFTCKQADDFTITENVEWISWANGFSNNWNAVEGETGMTQQLFFGPKGKNTTNQFYYGLENGGVTYTESTYTGLNERHVYELTRSEGKSIIKKDGVELYNGTKTGPTIKHYRLFGCILHENDASYSYNFTRNYGTKVIKNGSLFRDYVPALREADNEPGMYDRVSNTFFANKGTGTFIYKLKERQKEKVTRILYSGSKMRLVRNPTA